MVDSTVLSSSKEPEFGYGQLLQILLRRWPWIVGALGVSLVGAAGISSQRGPEYQSSMQLLVEPNYENEISLTYLSESPQRPDINDSDYATQLTLMRSDRFFIEAAKRLKSTYPDIDPEVISDNFEISQITSDDEKELTSVFEASFIDDDPLKTRQVLVTLRDIYIEYNSERQQERLTRGLALVNEQLVNTESSLRRAQASLEEFRQAQGLIDPALQGQTLLDNLNTVQVEQQRLASEWAGVKSQFETLQQQVQLSPQQGLLASRLSQAERVQGLLNTMQETSLALAQRRVLFTDEDPTVKALAAQQQNESELLRREISSVLRQPLDSLNSEVLSSVQLGEVDIELVSGLLTADATLKALESRAKVLVNTKAELLQDLERFPSLIAEYDRLQPRVDIERATLERLLEQREQLSSELARGGFTWEVVEPPTLGEPYGSGLIKDLALGAMVGLFLGGLLAFGREVTDNVLHTPEDLKHQVPLPVLGILPLQTDSKQLSVDTNQHGGSLPPVFNPGLAESELIRTITSQSFREAIDLMTNNLQLRSSVNGHKAICLTSALPGEGKTTVALGLGLSLARMNQRVLLIDADLRRSGLQAQIGINNGTGLSTFLKGLPVDNQSYRLDPGYAQLDVLPEGELVLQRLWQPVNYDLPNAQLDVLTAGPVPQDPIPLLSSPLFGRLLANSRETYDVILVDTPPVLGMADAIKVGSMCDSTVLISRLDRVTQDQLKETLSQLAQLRVLGIVANGAKVTLNRYVYEALPQEARQLIAH